MASQTISHYLIISKLGQGGMGEVYKAQDTMLERPVALKILPESLVQDPDRVRRFVQEAKSASALNHPNIVTIYETGEVTASIGQDDSTAASGADGHSGELARTGTVHYIAMEFVDGTTLYSKIHREKIPLKKLLQYMSQAADGLAKAHGAGIVHRDLKPENIMVTEDDYVKVLDFGLAKLVEPEGLAAAQPGSHEFEEAPTAVMQQSRAGMVMGTVGYMSPEQVQGKPVDQRSDIFSFGCILYEAATGNRPFEGDSLIDSLHKIVYAPAPPIAELNPAAPAELQRIVRKSLSKDPAERYQSIRDLNIDLKELIREYELQPLLSAVYSAPSTTLAQPAVRAAVATHSAYTSSQQVTPTGPVPLVLAARRGGPGKWILISAGITALATAVSLAFFVGRKHSGPASSPFQNTRITKLTSTGRSIDSAISPDGKYLAHLVEDAGQRSLWIKQVATATNVQIVAPSKAAYAGLSFSPDSNYVYFASRPKDSVIGVLYQMPALGGSPKKLLEDVDSRISFSPDRKEFVFVRNSNKGKETALFIANADGSAERKLASMQFPERYVDPQWSPDGKVIACAAQTFVDGYHHTVHEVRVDNGAQRPLTSQRWLQTLGLAWLADGSGLVLSGMDQTPGASQFQIWYLSYPEGKVQRITNDLNNYAGVTLTGDSAALATVQAEAVAKIWIVPNGDATRAKQITSGSGKYDQLSWTPDDRIVYVSDAGGTIDIWIMGSDGKNQTQLTSNAGINMMPSVSADGRYIAFTSNRGGNIGTFHIWRMDIDGGNPKELTNGQIDFWPTWSPDGKSVLYTPLSNQMKPAIWRASADGSGATQVCDWTALEPVSSPDGKLIAACSSETEGSMVNRVGIFQSNNGQLVKVLDIDAFRQEGPGYRWAPNGRALTYIDNRAGVSNIWSISIDGGAPRQITDFATDQIFRFDWSRDGKQIACSRGVEMTDVILLRDLNRHEKP